MPFFGTSAPPLLPVVAPHTYPCHNGAPRLSSNPSLIVVLTLTSTAFAAALVQAYAGTTTSVHLAATHAPGAVHTARAGIVTAPGPVPFPSAAGRPAPHVGRMPAQHRGAVPGHAATRDAVAADSGRRSAGDWPSAFLLSIAAALGAAAAALCSRRAHGAATNPAALQTVALMGTSSKKRKAQRNSGKRKAGPRPQPVNYAALVRASEAQHNKITAQYEPGENDDGTVMTEWIVAARVREGQPVVPMLTDWVPVATIVALAHEQATHNLARETVVGQLKKEISECVHLVSASLRSVDRDGLEYALEPVDSFSSHVMDRSKYEKHDDLYRDLGLEPGATPREIKTAYRKIAAQCHPDTFATRPEGQEEAAARLKKAQDAYTILGGGVGTDNEDSWYASLGGRARTDFSGPLSTKGHTQKRLGQELPLEGGGFRLALAPLKPEMAQEFLFRNASHHRVAMAKMAQEQAAQEEVAVGV